MMKFHGTRVSVCVCLCVGARVRERQRENAACGVADLGVFRLLADVVKRSLFIFAQYCFIAFQVEIVMMLSYNSAA